MSRSGGIQGTEAGEIVEGGLASRVVVRLPERLREVARVRLDLHMLRDEGLPLLEAVRRGSRERLAPVLMTALFARWGAVPASHAVVNVKAIP